MQKGGHHHHHPVGILNDPSAASENQSIKTSKFARIWAIDGGHHRSCHSNFHSIIRIPVANAAAAAAALIIRDPERASARHSDIQPFTVDLVSIICVHFTAHLFSSLFFSSWFFSASLMLLKNLSQEGGGFGHARGQISFSHPGPPNFMRYHSASLIDRWILISSLSSFLCLSLLVSEIEIIYLNSVIRSVFRKGGGGSGVGGSLTAAAYSPKKEAYRRSLKVKNNPRFHDCVPKCVERPGERERESQVHHPCQCKWRWFR